MELGTWDQEKGNNRRQQSNASAKYDHPDRIDCNPVLCSSFAGKKILLSGVYNPAWRFKITN